MKKSLKRSAWLALAAHGRNPSRSEVNDLIHRYQDRKKHVPPDKTSDSSSPLPPNMVRVFSGSGYMPCTLMEAFGQLVKVQEGPLGRGGRIWLCPLDQVHPEDRARAEQFAEAGGQGAVVWESDGTPLGADEVSDR